MYTCLLFPSDFITFYVHPCNMVPSCQVSRCQVSRFQRPRRF